MTKNYRGAALFAVLFSLVSTLGIGLLFMVSNPQDSAAMEPDYLIWTVAVMCLIGGPTFLLACVAGTVAGDLYTAFGHELEPQERAKLDKLVKGRGRAAARPQENLSKELKEAVLQAMMDEYLKEDPKKTSSRRT